MHRIGANSRLTGNCLQIVWVDALFRAEKGSFGIESCGKKIGNPHCAKLG